METVLFIFFGFYLVSIETAKQKMEKDGLLQTAELRILEKQKKLTELQKEFKQLLNLNQSLPEHLHLTHEVLMHHTGKHPIDEFVFRDP